MGRPPNFTAHQKKEAIKRRDHREETLAEIEHSYNVSGWTIFAASDMRELRQSRLFFFSSLLAFA
jgi:hypothetical protein